MCRFRWKILAQNQSQKFLKFWSKISNKYFGNFGRKSVTKKLCRGGAVRRHMAPSRCKNCDDFFFEIWNFFWQIFQNFFGKIYGYFGLTARWLYRRKYLHIPHTHSKLSMGHILGTFVQFFQQSVPHVFKSCKVCRMDANHAKCAACVHITPGTVQKRRHRMGGYKATSEKICAGSVEKFWSKISHKNFSNFGRKSVTNILEILVENQ